MIYNFRSERMHRSVYDSTDPMAINIDCLLSLRLLTIDTLHSSRAAEQNGRPLLLERWWCPCLLYGYHDVGRVLIGAKQHFIRTA